MELVNRNRLSLSIVMLSVVPLVAVTTIVATLLFSQAKQLVDDEVTLIRSNLINLKKQELQQYVELALKAVMPIYEEAAADDLHAQQLVIDHLSTLTYGQDGYFFVYDYQGVSLVLPYQQDRIGKNWWEVEDVTGKKLLQELIYAAQHGGGFVEYQWHKPSKSEPLPKLSYAVGLDKWQWMIGTGVYLDDIELQVAHVENGFDGRVGKSAAALFLVVFIAVSLVAGLGASMNFSVRRMANSQLSKLNQRIIESQEKERSRVSKELHDGINQLLVAAKYRLDNLRSGTMTARQLEQWQASQEVMDQAIVEIRRISRDLRPSQLDDLGLVAALQSHISTMQERCQMELIFEHDINGLELSSQVETTLYRVTQEALRNVEKHSQASGADVVLQREGDKLLLTISDDGVGFEVGGKRRLTEHMGLNNMRERIAAIAGLFWVESEPGTGTQVRIELPAESLREQGLATEGL
ncbi:cache domain-containing protein [Aliagarivorans marinus]|uniref:cache domain-containing protein n=1 Tax=Aliagarivorans marinus TaxID=561965 RepID=UPI0003F88BAC|nr:cache domain-containing protein [Aliagarivorans marinus]